MRAKQVRMDEARLRKMGACYQGIRYFRNRFGRPVRLTLNKELMESLPEEWMRWVAHRFNWTGTARPRRSTAVFRYLKGDITARRDDCGCGFKDEPWTRYRCSVHVAGWFVPANPMSELE